MAFAIYTKADAWPMTEGQIDVSPLLGHWMNTKSDTDYFSEVIVSQREGSLIIQLIAANGAEPIDWGETTATPYLSGRALEAAGFHARYDFGQIETMIAANQKLGILVIQSYTSFKDGSGRHNHFAREFFHRRGGRQ